MGRQLQMLLYTVVLLVHSNTLPLLVQIPLIFLIEFVSLFMVLSYLTGLQLNSFCATLRVVCILVSNFLYHQINLLELILMRDDVLDCRSHHGYVILKPDKETTYLQVKNNMDIGATI